MIGFAYLGFFLFLVIGFALVLLIIALIILVNSAKYNKTEYYQTTKVPYMQFCRNKGLVGEYYTYEKLLPLPGMKRFLFNCYVPKTGDASTEIDVILLHESGVYVFESKNFSGWIFGNESQKEWTQSLRGPGRQSKKNRFYNPIMQNKAHIKWLRTYLSDFPELPIYSYIVFSERCELKNVTVTDRAVHVVKREHLLAAVSDHVARTGRWLDKEKIEAIYAKLYPLTQTDRATKEAHIQRIRENAAPPVPVPVPPAMAAEPVSIAGTSADTGVANEPPPPAVPLCPRCGGTLILRTAKRGANIGGQFYGCSNYPKCKYTKPIDPARS